MVDGAELLVALPGQVDFAVGVAGVEAPVLSLACWRVGEVLDAVAEEAADLVERVVLVAAVAEGVLLDPAADFVDDLGAEPDHMEGVQHRDRVGQLVTDRVRVAAERVEGGVLDAGDERRPVLGLSASLVGGPGAAGDGVQQPGVEASVLVAGQVDHDRSPPGRRPRPATGASWVGPGRGASIARWSVSPGRPPNPACDFHRTGLST